MSSIPSDVTINVTADLAPLRRQIDRLTRSLSELDKSQGKLIFLPAGTQVHASFFVEPDVPASAILSQFPGKVTDVKNDRFCLSVSKYPDEGGHVTVHVRKQSSTRNRV